MTAPIRAAIIAAGEGSRLAASHPGLVKPLVPIAGTPLCHWVARGLREAGVREVTVLFNSRGRAARASLEKAFPDMSWTFLEADTASSWESFRLVSKKAAAQSEDFIVSTVDSLIPADQTAHFIARCRPSGAGAALALTSFVDDEKPLWADLEADGRVSALGPKARRKELVTSGLYYLTARVSERMPQAAAHASLRAYWGGLLDGGEKILGVTLSKTIDVDRPEDIGVAENFLAAKASSEVRTW